MKAVLHYTGPDGGEEIIDVTDWRFGIVHARLGVLADMSLVSHLLRAAIDIASSGVSTTDVIDDGDAQIQIGWFKPAPTWNGVSQ